MGPSCRTGGGGGLSRMLAGGGGFEPPLPGPEPGVLPLDDPPPSPETPSHDTGSPGPSQRTARTVIHQRTKVLSDGLGRKRGTLVDGILSVSPLRGLRMARAARRETTKVPKPLIVTRLPRWSDSKMPPTNAAIAFSAEAFEPPDVLAMIATRSAFVTSHVYAGDRSLSMALGAYDA